MNMADPRLGNPEWADNWTLGAGPRFELMEKSKSRVFLCQEEVTAADVDSFEPPDGYRHALAGAVVADSAFFGRSPGARVDGPLQTLELGGRRFAFVAVPVGFDTLPSGAVEATIDKHHSMLYRAGRTLDLLDFGDGTVATPAWGSINPSVELTDGMLDASWTIRRIRLTDDLLTTIPNPARVIILDGAFGFHGPVDSALIEPVAQEVSAQ